MTTDLKRLYAAIEGRTKGNWSWEFTHPGHLMFSEPHFGGSWVLDACGDANDQSVQCRPADRDFIATMGTCADQIAAVLRAAERICGPFGFVDIDAEREIRQAMAALAAACNTSGGTGK